jgi:hypothetical protein
MTEEQWLTAKDARAMLLHLWPDRTNRRRKLRLFACAVCRQFGDGPYDERGWKAVETDERYADGLANRKKMARARRAAQEAFGVRPTPLGPNAAWAAWAAVRQGRTRKLPDCHPSDGETWVAATARAAARSGRLTEAEERHFQFALVRDIFRPLPPLSPPLLAWNDGLVIKLAQAAYEDRLSLPGNWTTPALPCSPTPWKTPAARTPPCWSTCEGLGRTFAGAGPWTC